MADRWKPTKALTDTQVESRLKPETKKYPVFDPGCRGLAVMVHPTGRKSYTLCVRNKDGKQLWREMGQVGGMSLADARVQAAEGYKRAKAGLEPFPDPEAEVKPEAKPNTFGAVAANWMRREVTGKRRTADQMQRILDRYVLPAWKDKPVDSIRRWDVATLLDAIEDGTHVDDKGRQVGGPVTADRTLAVIRRLFNWHATRDDTFVSPVVVGMGRTSTKERARDRKLSDDEISEIWPLLTGNFGAMVKIMLLTAARREKVREMKWADIDDEGVWRMPQEAREKSNAGTLPLPQMARDIVAAQTKVAGNPYVFAGRDRGALAALSYGKARLDERVNHARAEAGVDPMPEWRLHDLRRTARSLMSRAGVRSEIAERTLGHVIPGVQGTYDRHDYESEKGAALEKLAGVVDLILNPPAGNVVEFGR